MQWYSMPPKMCIALLMSLGMPIAEIARQLELSAWVVSRARTAQFVDYKTVDALRVLVKEHEEELIPLMQCFSKGALND